MNTAKIGAIVGGAIGGAVTSAAIVYVNVMKTCAKSSAGLKGTFKL